MIGLAESGCRRTARQPEQPKSSSSDALDVDDDSMTILGQQPPTWSTQQEYLARSATPVAMMVLRSFAVQSIQDHRSRRGDGETTTKTKATKAPLPRCTSAEAHLCRGDGPPQRTRCEQVLDRLSEAWGSLAVRHYESLHCSY